MKFITRSAYLVLILSSLFLWQCTTTKKSSTTKQQATIQNVWFSDASDMDGDGYNSYARLNFDINVNTGSMNVSVWLGVRVTDPADTGLYYEYFVSAAFPIEGSNEGDAKFISIGDPNLELGWGRFDFLLQVFEGEGASDENAEVIAQASISSHSVLEDVPFEESMTDAGLVIYDAYWDPDSLVDNDNDGFYSKSDLVVDVDVNQGDSADVFLLLYTKASSSSQWDLLIPLDQTYTFTVGGSSSEDARMYGLTNFPHDTYDFAVEAYINDGLFQVEDMQDPSNNDLLNDWPLEPAEEDVGQVLEIYDAEWTDQVDNDADGYYSQANLVVDVDVNNSSADIYLKIYAKPTSSGTYNLIYTTSAFNIFEYSSADAYAIDISNFNHDSYDFKVEVFFAGDNTVQDEMDKNGDSDLGAVNLETSAEDQAGFELTFNNQAFTDIDITVTGYGSRVIPSGGSVIYNLPNNPGSITYHAETSGKTNTGTQIGLLMQWDYTNDISGQSSASYNLVISPDYFFIYITNSGTINLAPLYVNYGTANQTMDNIVIPNDGVKYRTGYYRAFSNLEVRMYQQGSAVSYVYWIEGTHFNLPFTSSQSVELLNYNKTEISTSTSIKDKITLVENSGHLQPAKNIVNNYKNAQNAQNVYSKVTESQ